MSEVSVSWRRRNPSARSALPLTRALARFNTPGVYILLDNKYELTHKISVNKTDAIF
jgi:hypothetical protein